MKDFEIRKSLHQDFLSDYNHLSESLIVDELKVCNGNAIMDVAVIDGSLIGFEIKSAYDNLSRLTNQMSFYNKVFDFITVVTCKNHLKGVINTVPKKWGIWVVEKEGNELKKFETRIATVNEDTDAFSTAQFLWKTEIIDLIVKRSLDKKICNKRKWIQWQYLADSLELQDLKNEVRFYLKSRNDWKTSTEISL
jgi:hypothetical protein